MLKYRLITAVVLIAAFLGLLFYTEPRVFCIFTEIIVLWAAWEWTLVMGLKQLIHRFLYLFLLLTMMQAIYFTQLPISTCVYFFYLTFFFWLLVIPLIALYPRGIFWKKSILCQAAMGIFVLLPCWVAINFIRIESVQGQYLLLYLFILVWTADSAAYFVGRRWGRKPLAPQVSPGKTWAGVYAGLMSALLVTLVILYWSGVPYQLWLYTLSLSLITIIFSVVGDLFESMLKRSEGLKDSGSLLPGHGGLLDRIDSLSAAAPIFTLGAIILSKLTA